MTSPPYWGLRDYGTARWEGGDSEQSDTYRCEDCDITRHINELTSGCPQCGQTMVPVKCEHQVGNQVQDNKAPSAILSGVRPGIDASVCRKCGAWRIDQQIGLEPTREQYVATMVAVFREVRRVLRDDGTVWLNLGDSYAGGRGERGDVNGTSPKRSESWDGLPKMRYGGLKPKDLCGIPWRVAFALQADGWYLRSDIIWAKPNPMPESVTDRPTRSHEYIFLLAKQERYFYDADAIREDSISNDPRKPYAPGQVDARGNGHDRNGGSPRNTACSRRNKRDVWTVNSEPTPEAHFATFPQALITPCILAGTSEKGCCAECGAPWMRVVEVSGGNIGTGAIPRGTLAEGKNAQPSWNRKNSDYRRDFLGWRPSCSHDAPVVPCLVLDPFLGSGTVGTVCERLGLRWAGLELSEDYIEIARRRTAQVGFKWGNGNGTQTIQPDGQGPDRRIDELFR